MLVRMKRNDLMNTGGTLTVGRLGLLSVMCGGVYPAVRPEVSNWTLAHALLRKYLKTIRSDHPRSRNYFDLPKLKYF